jgi:hypothetical protein
LEYQPDLDLSCLEPKNLFNSSSLSTASKLEENKGSKEGSTNKEESANARPVVDREERLMRRKDPKSEERLKRKDPPVESAKKDSALDWEKRIITRRGTAVHAEALLTLQSLEAAFSSDEDEPKAEQRAPRSSLQRAAAKRPRENWEEMEDPDYDPVMDSPYVQRRGSNRSSNGSNIPMLFSISDDPDYNPAFDMDTPSFSRRRVSKRPSEVGSLANKDGNSSCIKKSVVLEHGDHLCPHPPSATSTPVPKRPVPNTPAPTRLPLNTPAPTRLPLNTPAPVRPAMGCAASVRPAASMHTSEESASSTPASFYTAMDDSLVDMQEAISNSSSCSSGSKANTSGTLDDSGKRSKRKNYRPQKRPSLINLIDSGQIVNKAGKKDGHSHAVDSDKTQPPAKKTRKPARKKSGKKSKKSKKMKAPPPKLSETGYASEIGQQETSSEMKIADKKIGITTSEVPAPSDTPKLAASNQLLPSSAASATAVSKASAGSSAPAVANAKISPPHHSTKQQGIASTVQMRPSCIVATPKILQRQHKENETADLPNQFHSNKGPATPANPVGSSGDGPLGGGPVCPKNGKTSTKDPPGVSRGTGRVGDGSTGAGQQIKELAKTDHGSMQISPERPSTMSQLRPQDMIQCCADQAGKLQVSVGPLFRSRGYISKRGNDGITS